MRCKFCKKRITNSPAGWRLYGFLAGLFAVSQYRCGDDMYDCEMLEHLYPGEYEGSHEPDNSETSKVTDILLNYD